MLISIIFPVYNEEENLKILHDRLDSVTGSLRDYQFEFIFVDDCSSDTTPQLLKQIHERDRRIKIIRFARNCGSHAALTAGLEIAKGNCAVVLAADLQDPPEMIEDLLKEWRNDNRIVWGVRKRRREESFLTQFFSRLYYTLMNSLTIVKMPPLGSDVFLIDRVGIEALKQISEKHTSLFMTVAWLGFKQTSIPYVKEPRFSGRSKWSLGKKIKLTLDSLLAFSDIPIRYMSVIGFFIAIVGFFYAIYVVWCHFHGSPLEGWSSLIVAVLVIGGIQMIMLGVLGEYLWRTFDESRKRPRFIIEYKIE